MRRLIGIFAGRTCPKGRILHYGSFAHNKDIAKYRWAAFTLKAPITTKSDDNFDFFFYFQMKTSLDISCESSAKQMIHMKYQDLISLKNKKKKNKSFRMSSAANFAWRFKS